MKKRTTNLRPRPVASLAALRALGIAAVVTGAAAAACSDAPTQTPAAVPIQAEARLAVSSPMGDMLADASDRLTPSVEDLIARAELKGSLGDLNAALAAGDARAASRALTRARKVVSDVGADYPDIAAISLALDQVDAELGKTAPPK